MIYHLQPFSSLVGLNETNLSLSALTKEEYLFGIVNKQKHRVISL